MKALDLANPRERRKYYNSLKWKLITEHLIGKYHCCQKCKSTTDLCVHHTNYSNYPFEEEEDLIVLCKKCHFNHHNPKNKYSSEEEIEFRQISLQNAIKGGNNWAFNLQEISGINKPFLNNEKNYWDCEICGKKLGMIIPYPLKDWIVYSRGHFKDMSQIIGRNIKRKNFHLCSECRSNLNKNYLKIIQLTPILAKLLLTNPLEPPKKINKRGKNARLN